MGICPVGICPVGICPGVFVLESASTIIVLSIKPKLRPGATEDTTVVFKSRLL